MSERTAPIALSAWPEPLSEPAIAKRLPHLLATALPDFLQQQRWYGEKSRPLRQVQVDRIAVEAIDENWLALAFIRLVYEDDSDDARYFAPLLIERGDLASRVLGRIIDHAGDKWSVVDAPSTHAFQQWVIEGAASSANLELDARSVCSWQTSHPDELQAATGGDSRLLSGEQSNSNIAYGSAVILKVFRRVQPGLNPDVELGRYLTEEARSAHVAPLLADWTVTIGDDEPSSIGLAQRLVPNTGDGWAWLLGEMQQAGQSPERIDGIESSIRLLGQRTAEIHAALARGTDEQIAPKLISIERAERWRLTAVTAFEVTRQSLAALDLASLDSRTRALIDRFSNEASNIMAEFGAFDRLVGYANIRVHGDFHLGQTLRTESGDWVLIDFEGEPARSLVERRARNAPLKDVAGMIRSLAYARAFASVSETPCWTDDDRTLDDAFIAGYRTAMADIEQTPLLVPTDDDGFAMALRPWTIEKAIYEIAYEINNRPDWVWAPLAALFARAPRS